MNDEQTKPETSKAEQAIARRRAATERIAESCRKLNAAQDSVKWTPRSLDKYANALFETDDGMNALGFESLAKLEADLIERLQILTEKTDADNG